MSRGKKKLHFVTSDFTENTSVIRCGLFSPTEQFSSTHQPSDPWCSSLGCSLPGTSSNPSGEGLKFKVVTCISEEQSTNQGSHSLVFTFSSLLVLFTHLREAKHFRFLAYYKGYRQAARQVRWVGEGQEGATASTSSLGITTQHILDPWPGGSQNLFDGPPDPL